MGNHGNLSQAVEFGILQRHQESISPRRIPAYAERHSNPPSSPRLGDGNPQRDRDSRRRRGRRKLLLPNPHGHPWSNVLRHLTKVWSMDGNKSCSVRFFSLCRPITNHYEGWNPPPCWIIEGNSKSPREVTRGFRSWATRHQGETVS